jgi:hypothetical protein
LDVHAEDAGYEGEGELLERKLVRSDFERVEGGY